MTTSFIAAATATATVFAWAGNVATLPPSYAAEIKIGAEPQAHMMDLSGLVGAPWWHADSSSVPSEAVIVFAGHDSRPQFARAAVKAELETYKLLSDGWDGEESVAPAPDDLRAAAELINGLPLGFPVPKPMIGSDGEVGLYWNTEKAFADFVIEESGLGSLFVRRKDTGVEHFIDQILISSLDPAWLVEQLSPITEV